MKEALPRKFVPDNRWETAPPIPLDRPPTRAEVWAYVKHMYHDLKTPAELEAHAKATFVGNYVRWVNFNGWRKPPDWKEGQPAPPGRCPTGPIAPEEMTSTVYRLLGDTERTAA